MAWTTLVEILQDRAQGTPEGVAYSFLGNRLEENRCTYGQLHARAMAMAERLRAVVKEDDRVLICQLPGLDYISAFFGCLYAGVIAVPVYPPQYNKNFDRIRSAIRNAEPRAVITSAAIKQKMGDELAAESLSSPLDWVLSDDVGDAPVGTVAPASRGADSIAFLQYTSGSTAQPKGVMLSHWNLLGNLVAIQKSFQSYAGTRGCIWLPPYHDMGLIGGILQPLFAGIPVYLMSPMTFVLRPIRWLEAITRYRATASGGPNFAFDLCVSRIEPEDMAHLDLSAWEVAFCGAEPIRASTLDAFARKFAPVGFRRNAFLPCYGLAEASLIVTGGKRLAPLVTQTLDADSLTMNVARPAGDRPGRTLVSSGQVVDGTQVRVVNPQTLVACSDGEIGEIWISGPCVAQGYWGQPEQTERTFGAHLADGEGPYLRTGDLGYLACGELFVTGRLKDMIILKGRNYYPHDIEESVAASHPGLRSGCGVAFSIDEDDEERLVIVQEVESKLLDGDAARAIPLVKKAVFEAFELVPHDVVLVSRGRVAKTSSGKLQRQLIKQQYLAQNLEGLCSARGSAGPEPCSTIEIGPVRTPALE